MALSAPAWTHVSGLMPTKRPPVGLTLSSTLSAAGPLTYTTDQVLGGLILRDCNGAGRTDTLPDATALLGLLKGSIQPSSPGGRVPPVGVTVYLIIRNTSGGAFSITVAAGAGGSISGTATIAQNNTKEFAIVFTDVRDGNATYIAYSLGTSTF